MEASAAHGKGFFDALKNKAVCCDVLDAWFDPSPKAIDAFARTGLAMRSSPDLVGDPLKQSISKARSIPIECLTLGAGSSEIIHRVVPKLCGTGPAILLDPTYSEYAHVLQQAGCPIKRFPLSPLDGFQINLNALIEVSSGASLVVLVNPNNPTGRALTREQLLTLRASLSPTTTLWVDEAYVDYCPHDVSVERNACTTERLYVLKSLSKAYALSGLRAAYLVSSVSSSAEFSSATPPWIIGTSAQMAAYAAVEDEAYYAPLWRETNAMVETFAAHVRQLDLEVETGWINAVLVKVPDGCTSSQWATELAKAGLVVRTPIGMGDVLGNSYIRIGLVSPEVWPSVLQSIRSTLNRGIDVE